MIIKTSLRISATITCVIVASQMTSGCIPAAIAYGAYKWSQADQHEQDQKTARACLDSGQANTEFCQRILRETVRE